MELAQKLGVYAVYNKVLVCQRVVVYLPPLPYSSPYRRKKSPDLRKSRGSSCWTLGGPDPWTPGQRRPCSYSSLATL